MTEPTPLSRLEGRYLKALRHHIRDDAGTAQNRSLGDHAVAIGLETLDLARIHDQALAKLLTAAGTSTERETMTTQAGEFFTEAVLPLEETHRIALEASTHLMEIIETLGRRTEELASSKRELERETSDREASEAALKNSHVAFDVLLRESRVLEAQLKGMAQQILVTNENEKHLVSTQLRDEIAQTLLGLHVRLLALKKEVTDNHASITQEIAATQQLVEESVQTIQRFALELAPPVMKAKLQALARSYSSALRQHVRSAPSAPLVAARKLGHQAVKLGLETLDLARMHEEALTTLVLPVDSQHRRDRLTGHAGIFFAEALTPIEETHRGAIEASAHLKGIIETLALRTVELTISNDDLQREIERRRSVEDSLRTSEQTTRELLEKSRHMQEDLRLLSRRMLSAQEEERKTISRELHDVIAQMLTGINVRLTALKTKSASSTRDLQKKIEVTQRLVEKSVDIIHRFARDLRPAVLDDLGLIPAMRAYLKLFTEQTGIRTSFTAFAEVEKLDNASRTVLYRIAQEALTNVSRHAKASLVKLSIRLRQDRVCMEIHDDGHGFQVEDAAAIQHSKRLGLVGMRERAEMVGGTFCIVSAPGKPTTVHVELPKDKSSARKQRMPGKTNLAPITCP